MKIAIIADNYDNSILELKQLSSGAIEINKYNYSDDRNNYILCILNENYGNSHMSRVDKYILSESLKSDNELKMICDAWVYMNEDFKLR